MKFLSRKGEQIPRPKIEPHVSISETLPGGSCDIVTAGREISRDDPAFLAHHLQSAIDEILQGLETPAEATPKPGQQEQAMALLLKRLVRQILHQELSSGRLRFGRAYRS